jgi:hypothetical protein
LAEALMDPTSLRAVATNLGDIGGSGSATLTTGTIDYDVAFGAANADEVTAADNSALTTSSMSLTVAHQILSFGLSDLHSVVSAPGQLDIPALAAKMAQSYELRVTDMICTEADSISSSVGVSGADMTVDDFFSATATLQQALVTGPWYAVLAPIQMTDLRTSLRSEGGALQFQPATAEQLAIHGPGFQGMLLGVAIYSADSVTSAGGNRGGFMAGPGCIVYAEASASGAMPGSVAAAIPSGSPVYAEFVRAGDPGISRIVGHAFVATGLLENARGVRIVTDA